VRSEGFGKLKKLNDLIGTRTRDLPAYRVIKTIIKINTKICLRTDNACIHRQETRALRVSDRNSGSAAAGGFFCLNTGVTHLHYHISCF
jgi:hypothetical protein